MPAAVSEEVIVQLENLGIPRGSYAVDPLSRIQKMIATRLTESARDTPTFPLTIDVVIDTLLAQRTEFNAATSSRVSVNDLVIKACAFALKEVPGVNSSFTQFGLVRHAHADIAVAVATDAGLITPIVREADTKAVTRISADVRDLSERAKARRLQVHEYVGGTFAVSNLGMFGITSFGSIINPPHGAILSVGAGKPTPIVDSGQIRAATVMNVTLTCDHRVIDGAMGARWLQAFRRIIEQPKQLFE